MESTTLVARRIIPRSICDFLSQVVSMPREKRQKLSQDVPADLSPPVRGPRGRLGKEKVGDFYSESQIPIYSRRAGSIVIHDAPRSPSPAASESDDGGNEDEPGSESNPLRLYKTRAVDPDPRRPRVNYLKNLLKCGKDRMVSPDTLPADSQDDIFKTLVQVDWYNSVIMGRSHPVVEMKWLDWQYMSSKNNIVFNEVRKDALSPTSTTFLYEKDAPKDCLGTTRGLRPYYRVLYSILRWSLLPKVGDATALPGRHALLLSRMRYNKPDFSIMKLIWSEIYETRSESSSPIKKALRAIFCMCAKTAKKVKKIERRQKEDWIAAGKDVSDISDDKEFVDPFAAYETARDIASSEGPSGTSRFFNEESSHSEESSDDQESDAPTENVPTDPDEAVDAAGQDIDSPHSGDTEIIPSDGDDDEA
uniref:Uncharacterized protein n=1 Tax=Oryza sativa subsp. japonica TaxID=39947 RepID=Q7G6D0_ORYSJ|nr:Hypothetical protein [Oryza sativa Japonica Group]AAM47282.1 Hypothetical protein [Oryza sativa Japonica Group]